MNNSKKKTYNNKNERKSYNATTFKRGSDGMFYAAAAIAQLCDCCTRNELYITAFRVGIRKDYDIDTLLAIFHHSLSVRKYAKYLIDDIEANLAHVAGWEMKYVNWYKRNISDIKYFLDHFEMYVSGDVNVMVPHFCLDF